MNHNIHIYMTVNLRSREDLPKSPSFMSLDSGNNDLDVYIFMTINLRSREELRNFLSFVSLDSGNNDLDVYIYVVTDPGSKA